MHTGFFREGNPNVYSFEALRNIQAGKKFSAYDFLHGFCTAFAKILNTELGLPVEFVWSEDRTLVHAYCVKKVSGKVYFYDVRGITDNEVEFFAEFSENLNNLHYPQKDMTSCDKFLLPENEYALEAAYFLFKNYRTYYEL